MQYTLFIQFNIIVNFVDNCIPTKILLNDQHFCKYNHLQ